MPWRELDSLQASTHSPAPRDQLVAVVLGEHQVVRYSAFCPRVLQDVKKRPRQSQLRRVLLSSLIGILDQLGKARPATQYVFDISAC